MTNTKKISDAEKDYDLCIATFNKTKRAWEIFVTFINENTEIYQVASLMKGIQTFWDYPDRQEILDINLYINVFSSFIANNLCALLGNGRHDKLSVLKNRENYDTDLIDKFYRENRKQLKNLSEARNKIYAHIDTEIDTATFQHNISFLGDCVYFLQDVLLKEVKHE